MKMFDFARDILLAGLGAQEKIKEFVDDLVKKGELSESQGARIVKEWSEKASQSTSDLREDLSEVISKTLEKMHILTKEDIVSLDKKIETLSMRIAALEKAEKESN